jgi:acetyl-CoA carboxylase carboxyl transferase subunit alpha
MAVALSFEKPIAELYDRVRELRQNLAKEPGLSAEIASLEERVEALSKELFKDLTPIQKVQLSRHPNRPYTLDYTKRFITEFVELRGDRRFGDDAAIVAGIGRFRGRSVAVVGHQKGRGTKENMRRNFGMPHPEGYRKAIRMYELADRFRMPILTFIDTPGAYPGIGAEERGQSEAIGAALATLARVTVPVIATIIGEGGSGGALALGVANRVLVLEFGCYSVISPEGCAAILWKDGTRAEEAANQLKIHRAGSPRAQGRRRDHPRARGRRAPGRGRRRAHRRGRDRASPRGAVRARAGRGRRRSIRALPCARRDHRRRRLMPAADAPDLLAALAVAIREVGREAFFGRPIVEPTAKFFPIEWRPDERGVEALLRTLVAHADMSLEVVVSTDRDELGETADEPALSFHPGGKLWLSALEDRVALFGVDLVDIEDAAGAASHELAHAYRFLAHRGESRRSPYRRGQGQPDASVLAAIASDEARAQAVEIVLGFGVLALNHSLVRQSGQVAPVFGDAPPMIGAGFAFLGGARVMRPRPGHLSPEGVAFLFACQLLARGASDDEIEKVTAGLFADQRQLLRAELDRVRSRRSGILAGLGL